MTQKSQAIVKHLRNLVRKGALSPGDKIPSQYDLAKTFQVNKTTANKAVAQLVSEGLLRRERGAAGTVVNDYSGETLSSIGFLLELSEISFFVLMLRGAQSAAFRRGYSLQFMQWPERQEQPLLRDFLLRSGIKGLLVDKGEPPDNLPFPVVHIDQTPMHPERDQSVNCDNEQGGYLIGRHLIERGHSRIALVLGGAKSRTTLENRAAGFRRAAAESGLTRQIKIYPMGPSETNLAALIDRILAAQPNLDAIAFTTDPLAMAAIACLHRKGYRIPQDISVTGFGAVTDYHASERLTSIDQHPFTLGAHAAERVIDAIEGSGGGTIHEVLPVELYQGDTVATRAVRTNTAD